MNIETSTAMSVDEPLVVVVVQEDSYSFHLKGKAKPHVMYLEGVDSRHPDVESLAAEPRATDEEEGKWGITCFTLFRA